MFLPGKSVVMCQTYKIEPPASIEIIYESKERPDLIIENSQEGLRVVQMATNPYIGSYHIYTEAQVFTPDSKRFVFNRGGNIWLCDIKDNFGLRQLTKEEGSKGPSVSPDGKWMYYIIDRTNYSEGILKLKRVSLVNFSRETLLILDGPIPGTNFKPTRIYGLTSISSDGKRLCTSAFLGDGKTKQAPWGLLVFDLENPSVKLVENPLFDGKYFNNLHPQYCRSTDPILSHDILIQHNHNSEVDETGKTIKLVGREKGADIHVIRDDGKNWRDIPIGREWESVCPGTPAVAR